MGEAKRRRTLRTTPYIDGRTGEQKTARLAGDPLTFRNETGKRYLTDPDPEVPVPCHGCTECCWHAGTDLHEDTFDAPRLLHLMTKRRDDGVLYLAKKPDGSCVHLGASGCTVYEHRPHACRHYDCRMFALTGIHDTYDSGHKQPVWIFEPETDESRAYYTAMQLLGRVMYMKLLKAKKIASAKTVLHEIADNQDLFNQTIDAMLTVIRSPDAKRQIFGFDTDNPTPEDLARHTERMTRVIHQMHRMEDDLRQANEESAPTC